jgi:hypothetical protein
MLSDQLNGTQRVAVRGFNGVHLKRNIGYPPQDAIARQRSGDVLRVANVGVKLRQKIGDSVTNNIMTCGAMLGSLLAQAGFSDLQRVLWLSATKAVREARILGSTPAGSAAR